jgi:hypothetical protein
MEQLGFQVHDGGSPDHAQDFVEKWIWKEGKR